MKMLERYEPAGMSVFTGGALISCAPCLCESVPEQERNKLKAFRGSKNDRQVFWGAVCDEDIF